MKNIRNILAQEEEKDKNEELRDLWEQSQIRIEETNGRTSHVNIRANGKYNGSDFIEYVWHLLESVCYKTGMTVRAVYQKDKKNDNKTKSKHYLSKCLEDV